MNNQKRGFFVSLISHCLLAGVIFLLSNPFTKCPPKLSCDLDDPCTIPLEITEISDVSEAPISKPKVQKPKEQIISKIPEKSSKKTSLKSFDESEDLSAEKIDHLIQSLDVKEPTSPVAKKKKESHFSPKKGQEDLKKILKDLDEEEGPSSQTPMTDPRSSSPYGAQRIGKKMSMSIIDKIRRMLHQAWHVPMRSYDNKKLIVTIQLKMNKNGSVKSATILHQKGTPEHPAYQFAAESALRAIEICSPLPFPVDSYPQWKEFEFRFYRQ